MLQCGKEKCVSSIVKRADRQRIFTHSDVKDYNKTIKNTGLVKKGFKKLSTKNPQYDENKIMELWNKKYPDFIGYNCRIYAAIVSDKIRIFFIPQFHDLVLIILRIFCRKLLKPFLDKSGVFDRFIIILYIGMCEYPLPISPFNNRADTFFFSTL